MTLVKDKNCHLLADTNNILNIWKNNICLLLKLHGVNYVKQECIQLKILT